jgi:AcrR family transcriptional regulator
MLSTVPSTTPLSESALLATLAPAGGRQSAVGDVSDTAVRIMLAAADAFAQRGFHATTTRDIASRAGLSPAGVYVHFTSKEVLLFELSRRGHERARDLLVEAAAAADSPTEALRAIIGGFSRWHAEHYELGRIVQFEFRHLRQEHRDAVLGLRKEIDQVVAGVLRDGVDTGEFAVTDVPRDRARAAVDGHRRRPLVHPGRATHPRPRSRPRMVSSRCGSCIPADHHGNLN